MDGNSFRQCRTLLNLTKDTFRCNKQNVLILYSYFFPGCIVINITFSCYNFKNAGRIESYDIKAVDMSVITLTA